jgi:hypothetical protein
MNIADEARENALHCEMVKYAYRQTKDGVVVSFVVHPNDVPAELSSSHIGSRYMVALVELGDDETPKKPSKKDWREMTPASQAAIRCGDVKFRNFLRSEHGLNTKDKDEAATAVRNLCGVTSRMELATNHKARTLWHSIDTQYREWAHL